VAQVPTVTNCPTIASRGSGLSPPGRILLVIVQVESLLADGPAEDLVNGGGRRKVPGDLAIEDDRDVDLFAAMRHNCHRLAPANVAEGLLGVSFQDVEVVGAHSRGDSGSQLSHVFHLQRHRHILARSRQLYMNLSHDRTLSKRSKHHLMQCFIHETMNSQKTASRMRQLNQVWSNFEVLSTPVSGAQVRLVFLQRFVDAGCPCVFTPGR
jgi:hypothetical protein